MQCKYEKAAKIIKVNSEFDKAKSDFIGWAHMSLDD